jgi:site-specific DNA-methyltransferase (adenine-specific)
MDCMDLLKATPDNFYNLAIVDPPYGFGDISLHTPRAKGTTKNKIHKDTMWNEKPPSSEYFVNLFRVSKNQIIWGANYFPENLKISRGWIFWDKIYENTFNFSAGELAYTSFDKVLKMVRISQRWIPNTPLNIHPTQKPIKLYEWLLTNYAKQGDKILDTHLGSGSHAIACNNLGFELTACELDPDYFEASIKRITQATAQERLFE